MTDRVLILDFGSQVTQLIARRVREAGVYCEILPFNADPARVSDFGAKAVILSGGPASVTQETTPRAPDLVFDLGVPVLGICYGMQTMMEQLGGKVETSDHQEFGRAFLEVADSARLFEGVWERGERHQVWMSHGDRVLSLAPGFVTVGKSEGAPCAAVADDGRRFSTASSSIPRWCTRRTAPGCCPTSCAGSPAAAATGAWPPSAPRRSRRSAPRSATAR